MSRPAPPIMIETLKRELEWLAAVEAGTLVVRDIAREQNCSLSLIYRRLRRARENRKKPPDPPARSGKEELPWVEIVDGIRRPTPHYDLKDDRIEHPPGAFRIGDHNGKLQVQHEDRGDPVEPDPPPSEHKFRPKGLGKKGVP